MLASIALVAVVGGAFAFKAKYSFDYCTAIPIDNACPATLACPNLEENVTTQAAPGTQPLVCITIQPAAGCAYAICSTTPPMRLKSAK